MINAPQLLTDLKRRLTALETDLRERISAIPSLEATLKAEWQSARDANRTAETFESWGEQVITQAGVHWLLSCVFLRFIEDNSLVERPWIGGTPDSGRLNLARDRHEAYFRAHPLESDREYMLACFVEAGKLPGLHTFFDEAHNPVFRLGISGDAAMSLRQFWQQQDPNTGALLHDFTDAMWNTRFLGDLYQDLSEATRKRYALLQTPEFIEEFILDRTLTPAIEEFGYREVRMIDPTCGSGHFLLGGFHRMVEEWSRAEPTRNRRDVAQRALDAVSGVDLNPFAVAITRFRLLVAALQVSGANKLAEAPDFRFSLATGDSLLHGPEFGIRQNRSLFGQAETYTGTALEHAFASEDILMLDKVLGRHYHAVVGNPPYITVKDVALNSAYRNRYVTCHMKYSLGVPFTERFFELAMQEREGGQAGYVGLITANSFMKREFGKKLVEEFFPEIDLTHVIDTKNTYIPDHGTATVIMFGRSRTPISSTVRTVMSIRAESTRPPVPALGSAWLAITEQIDIPGSESAYASVADWPRSTFFSHPWSLGGGGAAELKDAIDVAATKSLNDFVAEVGFGCIISEEEAFFSNVVSRREISKEKFRSLVIGDNVRDWGIADGIELVFPYSNEISLLPLDQVNRGLWWARSVLSARRAFGNRSYREAGRPWWEFHQIPVERNQVPLSIVFAFVATQNHFSLDRGGKIFKQTAPIIKLEKGASENDHLKLLSELNSSTGCFWMKQTFMDKGGGGIGGGLATEAWEKCYEHDSTKIRRFPIVENFPVEYAILLDRISNEIYSISPKQLFEKTAPNRLSIDEARSKNEDLNQKMIAMQEELDWRCYQLYNLTQQELTHSSPPNIRFGERAFEIVIARRMINKQEETTWFSRHNATPITEVPSHWPESYRKLVEERISLIESDRSIGLIERPEYKRRWWSTTWEIQKQDALLGWMLDRLEALHRSKAGDGMGQLITATKLADNIRNDADFMRAAELYLNRVDIDLETLVSALVTAEAVPFLPVLRYSDTGLRKRAQWEDTWELQRREDSGDELGNIPVPPKYLGKDFLKPEFWRMRGSLDAPKERWISYPGCERGADGSLVIAWAGWDHLQQATAIAGYYLDMKDNEGWAPERLQVLLAGLLDLLPWLDQWHNEVDSAYGERMGNYYRSFVVEEARALGFTLDNLRNWAPAKIATKRGRKTKT